MDWWLIVLIVIVGLLALVALGILVMKVVYWWVMRHTRYDDKP